MSSSRKRSQRCIFVTLIVGDRGSSLHTQPTYLAYVVVPHRYLLYMFACLVERTWRFALPLVLAYIPGGYQAIAVLGFSSPLACSLLGPAAGRMLDTVYRPYGLGIMVALQGFAIIASGVTVLATVANPAIAFIDSPLFGILIALSMLERLAAISSELAIERDWVSQLAGKAFYSRILYCNHTIFMLR